MPINAYRDHLEQQFNRYRVPGAAVLLERDGEPLLHAGFGHADLAQERPVNKDTVFGVASITKSFTTMAVLQLVQAGVLCEEQRAADFYPAFTRPGLDRIEHAVVGFGRRVVEIGVVVIGDGQQSRKAESAQADTRAGLAGAV